MSNKRGSGNVFRVMLGLLVGGLTIITVLPVQAQETAAQAPVPLAEVADATRLEKALKATQGKVVLVNFWATWHELSVAQYPAFLYLYDRYHAQGLEVLSVATDPEKEREERVIPFIQYYKTKFPTYQKPDGDPTAFLKAIDTAWTGNLPRTYLIGRDGKIRQVLTTRIDAVKFETTIRRLLKEEAPKPKPVGKDGKADTPLRNPRGILGGN